MLKLYTQDWSRTLPPGYSERKNRYFSVCSCTSKYPLHTKIFWSFELSVHYFFGLKTFRVRNIYLINCSFEHLRTSSIILRILRQQWSLCDKYKISYYIFVTLFNTKINYTIIVCNRFSDWWPRYSSTVNRSFYNNSYNSYSLSNDLIV